MNPTTLSRKQIRAIFKRHHGSQSRAAQRTGITKQSLSLWLKGKFGSKRLALEVPRIAAELLASESDKPSRRSNRKNGEAA